MNLCLITLSLIEAIACRSIDNEPTITPPFIQTNSSGETGDNLYAVTAHTIGICEPYDVLMNGGEFDFATSSATVIMRWS